jgi:hypothetical protein
MQTELGHLKIRKKTTGNGTCKLPSCGIAPLAQYLLLYYVQYNDLEWKATDVNETSFCNICSSEMWHAGNKMQEEEKVAMFSLINLAMLKGPRATEGEQK